MSNLITQEKSFYQPIILLVNNSERIFFTHEILKINDIDFSQADITYLEPEETQSVSIDQIREMIWSLSKKDIQNKIRVFVITEVEKLKDVAQNSLLKILEEPPVNVLIILATNSIDHILQTVLSRSKVINYKENISSPEISEGKLLDFLEKETKINPVEIFSVGKNYDKNKVTDAVLVKKLNGIVDQKKIIRLILFRMWRE